MNIFLVQSEDGWMLFSSSGTLGEWEGEVILEGSLKKDSRSNGNRIREN